MKKNTQSSRRHFLKQGAVLGASLYAAPMILRAETLGLNGRVGPNGRINMGFIGMGGMMGAHMGIVHHPDVQPLYVCDVKPDKLAAAKQKMSAWNFKDSWGSKISQIS